MPVCVVDLLNVTDGSMSLLYCSPLYLHLSPYMVCVCNVYCLDAAILIVMSPINYTLIVHLISLCVIHGSLR